MRNLNITTETQRPRGIKVGEALCGHPGQPRRVAPTTSILLKSLLLIAALFTSACGSGGGGSSTSPSATISLSSSTPGSNTVYMAKNSSLSSGNTLAVDVKVNNVSNIYGAAFDVDFDSSSMTYDTYAVGSFLETGGNMVNYQVGLQSNNSNKLVVGIARQAGASGVSGSGTLITLKFKVTDNSSVAFSNNDLRDSDNLTISGITWSGGTVTVH